MNSIAKYTYTALCPVRYQPEGLMAKIKRFFLGVPLPAGRDCLGPRAYPVMDWYRVEPPKKENAPAAGTNRNGDAPRERAKPKTTVLYNFVGGSSR